MNKKRAKGLAWLFMIKKEALKRWGPCLFKSGVGICSFDDDHLCRREKKGYSSGTSGN